MARLRFEGLSHRYADDAPWVLEAVDLDVADGQAHALLGPSGAGKSTLLNLLSGLLHPTEGRVLLDDEDVTAIDARGRNLAQVFQFPVVYDGLSVRGNLEFPLRNRRFDAATMRARVDAIAELMELTELLRVKPNALSHYNRQKVAMARALVRPDVSAVLLDEPLTAVEPAVKWRLRQSLKQVQRELGLTMIYVTHDQLEALTFADKVSVLHGGRILQTASPEALYAEPAHTFVGHFIGSPGMNLVPASAFGADADLIVGFRPEEGRIATDAGAGMDVDVLELRPTGLEHGEEVGLVLARDAADENQAVIHIRQVLSGMQPGRARLQVDPASMRFFRREVRCEAPQGFGGRNAHG